MNRSTVVIDTTVWSNFGRAGAPFLVLAAFPGGVSPTAVIEEIERGIRLGFLEGFDLDFVEKVELTAPERDRARRFEESLDRGEAACLAVAVERSLPVLTDDRVARRAARSSGLAVSGTLGCLVRLIDGGRLSLDEADRLLSTMRRVGYRSPVVSLRDLV